MKLYCFMIFEKQTGNHLGPIFDLKKGKSWTNFWLYNIYIYIYKRICVFINKWAQVQLVPRFWPFFGSFFPSFIVKNRVSEMLLRCPFFSCFGAHLKKTLVSAERGWFRNRWGVFLQKWAILGLFGEASRTQTEINQKFFNIPRDSVLFPIKHDWNPGNVKFYGLSCLSLPDISEKV